MHAAHFRAHNKIIFPPTLRLLPLWTLGEACRAFVPSRKLRVKPRPSSCQHTCQKGMAHTLCAEVEAIIRGGGSLLDSMRCVATAPSDSAGMASLVRRVDEVLGAARRPPRRQRRRARRGGPGPRRRRRAPDPARRVPGPLRCPRPSRSAGTLTSGLRMRRCDGSDSLTFLPAADE